MTRLLQTLCLSTVMLVAGCSRFMTDGDYYFLRHKGAVMPVWVKGNLHSGTFLISIHGGPGASGHEFEISPGFQKLEKDYAVVYWDQRFSGLSQGDPSPDTLTVDQFVEDLDRVVGLVNALYEPDSTFLIGHSWGGGLGTAWLGRDDHQEGINGWINLDGSTIDELEVKAMERWITRRVAEEVASGDPPEKYKYMFDWYEQHPKVVYSDPEPYIFASILGAYAVYDPDNECQDCIPYLTLLFNSPWTLSFYTNRVDDSMADGIDFRPEMNAIEVPTLLLWGADDGIIPVELIDTIYEETATAPEHKHVVILDECAHSPHWDEPTAFATAVREFMETYQ